MVQVISSLMSNSNILYNLHKNHPGVHSSDSTQQIITIATTMPKTEILLFNVQYLLLPVHNRNDSEYLKIKLGLYCLRGLILNLLACHLIRTKPSLHRTKQCHEKYDRHGPGAHG